MCKVFEEIREKGREEEYSNGKSEGVYQTAKNLTILGVNIEIIMKATGLYKEIIYSL